MLDTFAFFMYTDKSRPADINAGQTRGKSQLLAYVRFISHYRYRCPRTQPQKR